MTTMLKKLWMTTTSTRKKTNRMSTPITKRKDGDEGENDKDDEAERGDADDDKNDNEDVEKAEVDENGDDDVRDENDDGEAEKLMTRLITRRHQARWEGRG
jgi:hypothetical protein